MPEFYERYWEKGNLGRDWFDLKWKSIAPLIPYDKEIIILDLGCGDGSAISRMKDKNSKARFIGLDVSETALRDASASLPGVKFHKIYDGQRFPIDDETIDFIFCSEVIEHIYDTANAFKEITRVLKKGGRTLITTPYHGFLKNLLIIFYNFDSHFNPLGPHIRFFSKKSLISCLHDVDLRIVQKGYFGRFYPIPHCFYVLAEK